MQVQEAQRVAIKMHPNRPTSIHIRIKIPNVKDKERILKAAREKQILTCKGAAVRLAVVFSTE